MKLIFDKTNKDYQRKNLKELDVLKYHLKDKYLRETPINFSCISESELSRHYSDLASKTFGINKGFYPLGSCTMKYNPKLNEFIAGFSEFNQIHPLQDENSVSGALEVYYETSRYLSDICGMDEFSFQPAAGSHAELTGLMMIKKYHEMRGDNKRNKVIVPDSAHGTNPATASMCGYQVINLASSSDGKIDLELLKEVVGDDTAALMLTNPNTLGIFDENILEITKIISEAGGLNYYDGANLNAIMGNARPGDMGFDVIHLNIHKTFATPHGGGGPGSGALGFKSFLSDYQPIPRVVKFEDTYKFDYNLNYSVGKVKAFYGNFLVVLRCLVYLKTLGSEGIAYTSKIAVLNARYMMERLSDIFDIPYKSSLIMHEFVVSLENAKKIKGLRALDFAKALLDEGVHPPTIYFPLIVKEAVMIEPTETENLDTIEQAIKIFKETFIKLYNYEFELTDFPKKTSVGRLDEERAVKIPILRYEYHDK